jgi:hypothetical protein
MLGMARDEQPRDEQPGGAYLEAIRRAFQFAREHGRDCGPADFLIGIAAGTGPAAAALRPSAGPSLAEVAADAPSRQGGGYLHMQAQEAATSLAAARGQPAAPEHLLIALLDQGTPEVTALLSRAGLDPAAIRRSVLAAVGAPADLPPIPVPAPAPAGTLDRPPLPVADLDARAWAVLRWRQEHLPMGRLRRSGDLRALIHLERAAAERLADRLSLDDDQRYSLIWQHASQVSERIATRTDLIGPSAPRPEPRRPKSRRPGLPVGWAAWFSNRHVALRDRWFRLRTTRHYRGCPQP